MSELLPCPFCGGSDVYHVDHPSFYVLWYVKCGSCGVEGPWNDDALGKEKAESAWNTRAQSAKEQSA